MKKLYRGLTTEELSALQYFAKANGRNWKDRLRQYWIAARIYEDMPVLHCLRNELGPAWLNSFRLSRPMGRIKWPDGS